MIDKGKKETRERKRQRDGAKEKGGNGKKKKG